MYKLSLRELGTQYLQQSEKIRERIRQLREALPTLQESERQDMLIRIHSLYVSALDLKETGTYLFNYYGGDDEKDC